MKLAQSPAAPPAAKPRVYKKHQSWCCFSSNASGEGSTAEKAYKAWKNAQKEFERKQRARPRYVPI